MNKKYWEKWYQKKHEMTPSNFAKFCLKYIPKKSIVLDIGCGNGRDSYFFNSKGLKGFGIDENCQPKDRKWFTFDKINVNEINYSILNEFCVVYSRFFLQAIKNKEITKLIKWTKGMFMAECRAKGDKPKLYKNHKRNLIDGNKLIRELIENKFDILYYKKSKGLAKYKGEDPLIIRIIAKKIY